MRMVWCTNRIWRRRVWRTIRVLHFARAVEQTICKPITGILIPFWVDYSC